MMVCSEWGGCLPLETHIKPLSIFDGFSVLSVNTGRAAVYAAVLNLRAKEVWVPYYLCPTVSEFLIANGVVVHEYHIDADYCPVVETLSENAALLWTNWFGCMKEEVRQKVVDGFAPNLIIDNCHAFFEKPKHGVQNVYSCRKFLGVPQGAFLVADEVRDLFSSWEVDEATDYGYLRGALRNGSNSVYPSYLAHEEGLRSGYRRMDPLVQAALSGIDLEFVKAKRTQNLDILKDRLGDYQLRNVESEAAYPVWFPLYVEDEELRSRLIESGVFVPRLWKRILFMPDATELERSLASYLYPLPIDQRYEPSDIETLADCVRNLIEG